ncbi:MAG TPA: hypothetical protein VFV99_30320 [Kofleriaceae bacterium]|nr:hypothetical protein [Kofleriaceae bacterium]
MRILVWGLLLAVPQVASAEPRWSFGWRSAISSDLTPPPWLICGGQWRWRVVPGIALGIDGDGGRGDRYETHDALRTAAERTMAKAGASVSKYLAHGGPWEVRVFGGGGLAVELTHVKVLDLDWVQDRIGYRPQAFAGVGVERLWPRTWEGTKPGAAGVALELRGMWLAGDAPMSAAPELSRFSVQLALELNAYTGQ